MIMILHLLVHEDHAVNLMGHFGVKKTLDVLLEHLFNLRWNMMYKEYVKKISRVGKPNLRSYIMGYILICLYQRNLE
jgi:hypothetical protein